MSSPKKQKLVAARAAMDALIANDETQARILMEAAPIPPRWKSIDEDWRACLAHGLAAGSRSADAQKPLFEKLRDVQPEGVYEFWHWAISYAWELPVKDGVDPFVDLVVLHAQQRAEWIAEGRKDPFGMRGKKNADWRGLNLDTPQGGVRRWEAALALDAGLAQPLWRSAVAGISESYSETPSWRRSRLKIGAPKPSKEELRAQSETLARMAADCLSLREREQNLSSLSSVFSWGTEPETQGWDQTQRAIKMPARGFNAAAAILEERGARWDARAIDHKSKSTVAAAEKAAQKQIKLATARVALEAKKAAHGGNDAPLREANKELDRAERELREASRAQNFHQSLIMSTDFGAAFERARSQLGSKAFWAIYEGGLMSQSTPARQLLMRHEDDADASTAKQWRALLLRADSELPERVAGRALSLSLQAVIESHGKIPAAPTIKVWKGLCDFENTKMSDWIRWPARAGGTSWRLLPTPQELERDCKETRTDTLALMIEVFAALNDLGVPMPWRATDLDPHNERTGAFRSLLERAELNEMASAGRKAAQADPAPAKAEESSAAARPKGPLRV